ncbi:CHAP domain-containing protein [Streptococcus canis]|uniref:CHAP domain-containing protein n=1 Tax=Streptococcus canis TaxID=1329 RepID=UPI002949C267|nr:CHAP domain-containing protein [Streptococcus canis]MDV5987571.1 CHAP domain-containing protein [Streptococcus canis]
MKKKLLLVLTLLFFPLFLLFLLTLFFSQEEQKPSNVNGVFYVKHWSGDSAYTHHFLGQRYGITEEQIDGFIRSQGYEPVGRASGKEFLKAQQFSGIDVRVLVAFAQAESSYGTAGVAKQYPEANIWGYGCVDNDPNQGRFWSPERAFNDFRDTQIMQLGNYSVAIMDRRAIEYKNGTLPIGKGVYYTDTTGTGKVRADIMEAFDKYIDEHGGTPEPPNGFGSSASVGGGSLRVLDEMLGQRIWGGQCYMATAYYVQALGGPTLRGGVDKKIGASGVAAADIGTDYDWFAFGWTMIANPKASDVKSGDVINFKRGAEYSAGIGYGVDSLYGHTAIVGEVKDGNRVMIYDQNPSALTYHEIVINDYMLSSIVRKGR